MNPDHREEAEKLASLPYSLQIISDETTDGEPCFVAMNPELQGCIGQGPTEEEAIEDLSLARIDYIHSLLDDDLPVPISVQSFTTTSSSSINSRSVKTPDYTQTIQLRWAEEFSTA